VRDSIHAHVNDTDFDIVDADSVPPVRSLQPQEDACAHTLFVPTKSQSASLKWAWILPPTCGLKAASGASITSTFAERLQHTLEELLLPSLV
jgi:hypothetical protein